MNKKKTREKAISLALLVLNEIRGDVESYFDLASSEESPKTYKISFGDLFIEITCVYLLFVDRTFHEPRFNNFHDLFLEYFVALALQRNYGNDAYAVTGAFICDLNQRIKIYAGLPFGSADESQKNTQSRLSAENIANILLRRRDILFIVLVQNLILKRFVNLFPILDKDFK